VAKTLLTGTGGRLNPAPGRTLRDLAAAVRSRTVGAHELVSESLRRIEAMDPDLGAVVAMRAEKALDDARALDAELARGRDAGVLAGLPLLVKDMTDVAGMRTTFGSAVFAAAPAATTDALVVARLRAAGAIVVGKTNLPEFACQGFTSNLLFGTTRNPWNRERTCGGSSGGSAVALSTGMASIATATDGGGSIRTPAAYCGLFGLKPTNGVIARDPIPDWIDYSTDGPLSPHAEDLRVLLEALAGPAAGDPTAAPVKPLEGKLRIGRVVAIERTSDFGPLPDDVARLFDSAIGRFTDVFGVEVERTTPGELFGELRVDEDWFTVCGAEHAHLFGRAWFDAHVNELHPSTRSSLGAGFSITIEEYLAARRRRFEYVRVLDDRLGDDGLLLSPVMAVDAFAADGRRDGATGPELYVTPLQNITGHPALSMPAGAHASGIPFGLQVTAPRFRDAVLIQIAERWEEATQPATTAPGYEPLTV
jgi:Asp-tRNA(Asn)/Glu-tRNA(Gln) amidotransferase A subunit family amidase